MNENAFLIEATMQYFDAHQIISVTEKFKKIIAKKVHVNLFGHLRETVSL